MSRGYIEQRIFELEIEISDVEYWLGSSDDQYEIEDLEDRLFDLHDKLEDMRYELSLYDTEDN